MSYVAPGTGMKHSPSRRFYAKPIYGGMVWVVCHKDPPAWTGILLIGRDGRGVHPIRKHGPLFPSPNQFIGVESALAAIEEDWAEVGT